MTFQLLMTTLTVSLHIYASWIIHQFDHNLEFDPIPCTFRTKGATIHPAQQGPDLRSSNHYDKKLQNTSSDVRYAHPIVLVTFPYSPCDGATPQRVIFARLFTCHQLVLLGKDCNYFYVACYSNTCKIRKKAK